MGLCKRRTYAYERLLYVRLPHNQVDRKVNGIVRKFTPSHTILCVRGRFTLP